jgi:hypothetical protein
MIGKMHTDGVDFRETEFPCSAAPFDNRTRPGIGIEGRLWKNQPGDTHYVYLLSRGLLHCDAGSFHLQAGTYFSVPGNLIVDGGHGLVITRHGYTGLFALGGPIEATGRLRYIDGCTDTLLIGPPRCGDPCLNHLHFPPGIRQTMHTHPSVRIGVVARGRGRCVTPEGELPLLPGQSWYLPVDGQHCFYTDDESMDIIAWHPDSDTGPRDEDHPMINRTMVEGVSAA